MADLSQLETALVNADKAGDTNAARMLAEEIQKQRSAAPSDQGETGAKGFVKGAMERGYINRMQDVVGLAVDPTDPKTYQRAWQGLKKIPETISQIPEAIAKIPEKARQFVKEAPKMTGEQLGATVEPAIEALAPAAPGAAKMAFRGAKALGIGEDIAANLRTLKPKPVTGAAARKEAVANAIDEQRQAIAKETIDRKAAIQSELAQQIKQEKEGLRTRNQAVVNGARQRIEQLHKEFSVYQEVPSEHADLHNFAVSEADLPNSWQLESTRGSTGESIRDKAVQVHNKVSEKAEKEGDAFYDRLRDRARQLQARGQVLTSPTNKAGQTLVKRLDRIIGGDVSKGTTKASRAFSQSAARLRTELMGRNGNPADIKLVLREISRLKEMASPAGQALGYDAAVKADALELVKLTEKAVTDWLGSKYYNNEIYAGLMEPVNRFNTPLGQKLVGRAEIPYVGQEESPHLTNPANLPQEIFSSKSNVAEYERMVGRDEMMENAERHVSDQLRGIKTPEGIKAWINSPENSWLQQPKFRSLKRKALKYQETYETMHGQAKEADETRKRLQSDLDLIPKEISANIKAAFKESQARQTTLRGKAEEQFKSLETEMAHRHELVDRLTDYISDQPLDRVPEAIKKSVDAVKQLPNVDQQQIAKLQQALQSIQKMEQSEARRSAIKKWLTGTVLGGGAAGLAYEVYSK
jgi:hypothetical protein